MPINSKYLYFIIHWLFLWSIHILAFPFSFLFYLDVEFLIYLKDLQIWLCFQKKKNLCLMNTEFSFTQLVAGLPTNWFIIIHSIKIYWAHIMNYVCMSYSEWNNRCDRSWIRETLTFMELLPSFITKFLKNTFLTQESTTATQIKYSLYFYREWSPQSKNGGESQP